MYTTTHTCTLIVNVSVIIEPFRLIFSQQECKHVNPYTNTTKTHSLFECYFLVATFKSREHTHVCVCDMENFYTVPVLLDPRMMKPYGLMLITNVISKGSREPVLLWNLVRVSLLTNSKFLSGWRLRPKQSRHLHTPTNKLYCKYANINFIWVWRFSKFTKMCSQ